MFLYSSASTVPKVYFYHRLAPYPHLPSLLQMIVFQYLRFLGANR